jgi:hypothetical protein
MVNLHNQGVRVPVAQGRARARAQQQVPRPYNEYHAMLLCMGLSHAAIMALMNLGLDQLDAFCDITQKDIPLMVKDLWRNNVFVQQTSQNYLQAL